MIKNTPRYFMKMNKLVITCVNHYNRHFRSSGLYVSRFVSIFKKPTGVMQESGMICRVRSSRPVTSDYLARARRSLRRFRGRENTTTTFARENTHWCITTDLSMTNRVWPLRTARIVFIRCSRRKIKIKQISYYDSCTTCTDG